MSSLGAQRRGAQVDDWAVPVLPCAAHQGGQSVSGYDSGGQGLIGVPGTGAQGLRDGVLYPHDAGREGTHGRVWGVSPGPLP